MYFNIIYNKWCKDILDIRDFKTNKIPNDTNMIKSLIEKGSRHCCNCCQPYIREIHKFSSLYYAPHKFRSKLRSNKYSNGHSLVHKIFHPGLVTFKIHDPTTSIWVEDLG